MLWTLSLGRLNMEMITALRYLKDSLWKAECPGCEWMFKAGMFKSINRRRKFRTAKCSSAWRLCTDVQNSFCLECHQKIPEVRGVCSWHFQFEDDMICGAGSASDITKFWEIPECSVSLVYWIWLKHAC